MLFAGADLAFTATIAHLWHIEEQNLLLELIVVDVPVKASGLGSRVSGLGPRASGVISDSDLAGSDRSEVLRGDEKPPNIDMDGCNSPQQNIQSRIGGT